jgi:DNA-binding response OmpR family regulator
MVSLRCILIIDDDQSIQELLGTVLAEEGYRVITTSHHTVTPDIIAEYKPDLILVDIPLLGKSESRFLHNYQQVSLTSVPIIILTTSLHPEQIGEEFQAAGVLEKPFDLDNLVALVNNNVLAGC